MSRFRRLVGMFAGGDLDTATPKERFDELPDGSLAQVVSVGGWGAAYGDCVVDATANDATAYTRYVPNASNLEAIIRARLNTASLQVASDIVHKIADANGIAATRPAVSEAESYALINEIADDYDVHIASLVYHVAADLGSVSAPAATDEATLVARANNVRTLLGTHAANTTAHGGRADAVLAAAVAATTVATDAASAITLENALATAWLAHIAVVDAGEYQTIPPEQAYVHPSTHVLYLKPSASTTLEITEYRSA